MGGTKTTDIEQKVTKRTKVQPRPPKDKNINPTDKYLLEVLAA
jgi:hypothetical protein